MFQRLQPPVVELEFCKDLKIGVTPFPSIGLGRRRTTTTLGDFHAHHPSWYSRSTDTRGKRMDDSTNGSDYGILNWDSPTRVPPNIEPNSPDVSLASTSLVTSCSWLTLSTLSSDHLPILIRLQMKTPSDPGLRRTYLNF